MLLACSFQQTVLVIYQAAAANGMFAAVAYREKLVTLVFFT